jgi:hypothetical protein
MREQEKTSNRKPNNKKESIRQHKPAMAGRKPSIIAIQAGESDEGAIRAFISDCLVPILAERFMSEREKKK